MSTRMHGGPQRPDKIKVTIQVRILVSNSEENRAWVERLSKELMHAVGPAKLTKPPKVSMEKGKPN